MKFDVTLVEVFSYEILLRDRIKTVEAMINSQFFKLKEIIRSEKKKVRDAKIEEASKEEVEKARENIKANAE